MDTNKQLPFYRIVFSLDFFQERGVRYFRKEIVLTGVRTDQAAVERFSKWKEENLRDFEGRAYSTYPTLEKIVLLATWQGR